MTKVEKMDDQPKVLLKLTKLTDEFNKLRLDGKAINEERAALIAKVEALGVDRKAFKDMALQRDADTEKRQLYEEGCRTMRRVFGWPEQLGMFDDGIGAGSDEEHEEHEHEHEHERETEAA